MDEIDFSEPILPYAGTSGWSGSETSKERAISQDGDGTTFRRQKMVLNYLDGQHDYGITWAELANHFRWHHGTASGILSVLHKAGLVARLTEKRDRCAVYVLPPFVEGREIVKRKVKTCHNCGHEL